MKELEPLVPAKAGTQSKMIEKTGCPLARA